MSRINAKTKICMIIGDPVGHSLSPRMHNAAYEELKIDDKFVFTAASVSRDHLKDVLTSVLTLDIRGICITMPHKTEIMQYLKKENIDPIALKIGAVNTIVNDNGILKAYNTDWQGVLTPLERLTSLKDKKVVILGAGGAARAMAYAVTSKGAKLTVFNRTLDKAQVLAKEFGGTAEPFENIQKAAEMDIILNATALGMSTQETETPLPKEFISENQIIFDAIYSPYETRFLREAQEQGARVIHGVDMLLHQGTVQFELFTKRTAPAEIMREVLIANAK